LFLEQNPNLGCFDIYKPSWEYLQDCPKFVSIMKSLQSNPNVRDKKKTRAAGGQEEGQGSSTDDVVLEQRSTRPQGNKAAKRKAEGDLIVENVTTRLKDVASSTSSGTAVASAIKDFSSVLSAFFADWQDKTNFQSVDPALRKTYEELKIKERIREMEEKERERLARVEAERLALEKDREAEQEEAELLGLEKDREAEREEAERIKREEAERLARVEAEQLALNKDRQAEQLALEKEIEAERELDAERAALEKELELEAERQLEVERLLKEQALVQKAKELEETLNREAVERRKEAEDREAQPQERRREIGLRNYVPWAFPLGLARNSAPTDSQTQIIWEEKYEDSIPVYINNKYKYK
jgi:hypothetical protein